MKFTRAEIEQAIQDNDDERQELTRRLTVLDVAEAELRGQLDGFCRAKCDHGDGCKFPRHHEPRDRHESAHCVFYSTSPVPPAT